LGEIRILCRGWPVARSGMIDKEPLMTVKHAGESGQLTLSSVVNTFAQAEYIDIATDLVRRTPADVIFHRLTGTASKAILHAPDWCLQKWLVLDRISDALRSRSRSLPCPVQQAAGCRGALQ